MATLIYDLAVLSLRLNIEFMSSPEILSNKTDFSEQFQWGPFDGCFDIIAKLLNFRSTPTIRDASRYKITNIKYRYSRTKELQESEASFDKKKSRASANNKCGRRCRHCVQFYPRENAKASQSFLKKISLRNCFSTRLYFHFLRGIYFLASHSTFLVRSGCDVNRYFFRARKAYRLW